MGFSGARTGQHKQGTLAILYGFALAGIQAIIAHDLASSLNFGL
jgi:hypothetical protein